MPHKDPITTIGLAATLALLGLAAYLYLPALVTDQESEGATQPTAPAALQPTRPTTTPLLPMPSSADVVLPPSTAQPPLSRETALQNELQRLLEQVEKLEQENDRLAQEIDHTEQESQQLNNDIEKLRQQ